MKNELNEVIQYHIDNKMILNIERAGISELNITGFPIFLTGNYLLMTNIYDFHDEGYVLIKTEDITDAYSNEDEAFYETVCIRENLHCKISTCPIKDMQDLKSIIEIIKHGRYITFHCEKENERCNFFMGKVKNISNDYVELLSLGADGKWNDKTDIVYFLDITMIVIDDNYAKMFYKYVEEN